jgi:hypothetical protein
LGQLRPRARSVHHSREKGLALTSRPLRWLAHHRMRHPARWRTYGLVRHLAAPQPGAITSITASAKAGLRALSRRWLAHDEEISFHDAHLGGLTRQRAPELVGAHGMGAGTAAEMLWFALSLADTGSTLVS